jgi:hypothetical protein
VRDTPTDITRRRIIASICILMSIPIGFALRFYRGPADFYVNAFGGGIMYEIFWMLVAFVAFPRRRAITPIAIVVCALTCIVEVLQLSQAPILQLIRSTFVGRTLIGTTFAWWDFPAYPIGCTLGWLLLRRLTR